MRELARDLLQAFWGACKERPAGMFAPFAAFWRAALHNPVLERRR